MPKMINIVSTGLQRPSRLADKPQTAKWVSNVFTILSLAVIIACQVFKHPQTLFTRVNQHIQDININSNVTISHFGHMVFAENQQQNKTYNFNKILSLPEKVISYWWC